VLFKRRDDLFTVHAAILPQIRQYNKTQRRQTPQSNLRASSLISRREIRTTAQYVDDSHLVLFRGHQ
jgi:hypothetical protein